MHKRPAAGLLTHSDAACLLLLCHGGHHRRRATLDRPVGTARRTHVLLVRRWHDASDHAWRRGKRRRVVRTRLAVLLLHRHVSLLRRRVQLLLARRRRSLLSRRARLGTRLLSKALRSDSSSCNGLLLLVLLLLLLLRLGLLLLLLLHKGSLLLGGLLLLRMLLHLLLKHGLRLHATSLRDSLGLGLSLGLSLSLGLLLLLLLAHVDRNALSRKRRGTRLELGLWAPRLLTRAADRLSQAAKAVEGIRVGSGCAQCLWALACGDEVAEAMPQLD